MPLGSLRRPPHPRTVDVLLPLTGSRDDAWFRRRPGYAYGVAGALFASVFALRVGFGDAADAYTMLFVLPVALLAVAFGLRAGLLAGLTAVGLTVTWALIQQVSLGPLAWTSRVVPLLLLGVLLGHAADRVRRAESRRRDLEAAALLHKQAIEINDSLIQGLAAARWTLQAGHEERGLVMLDETIDRAQQMVSGLIRRAEIGEVVASAGEDPAYLRGVGRSQAPTYQVVGGGAIDPAHCLLDQGDRGG